MSPAPRTKTWRLLLLAGGVAGCLGAGILPAQVRTEAAPVPNQLPSVDAPVVLDVFQVTGRDEDKDFDSTGMGSMEHEMRDEPFSNDLIDADDYTMDADSAEMAGEMSAIAETSPAERIAGEDRLNLRGFPTPMQRNGFIQVGIPETLNTRQTIVIQGPLIPVLGRAAPGGIQNFLTARPEARPRRTFTALASNRNRQRYAFEATGPVVPKKVWQRLSLDWQRRIGPQQFADENTFAASAALTVKHSRSASTLLSLDFRDISATAAPGIVEYIPQGSTRIAGPYLPLALFNANGPAAGIRRRTAIVGAQFDGQPTRILALRASVEGWWRTVEQDRFTNSQLSLNTGMFAGVREPRHLEMPQKALTTQLESTLRFHNFGAEHKLLVAASSTWGEYQREDRALPVADRNALPSDVLRFNPYAPNFYRPPFDPEVYSRVLTDHLENARYVSGEVSDRIAYQSGRVVLTAGLRYDGVDLRVEDRRPNATRPYTADGTRQLSYHSGVNYQMYRNRLLWFASTSTAFDPSTPVDARTGRIQDNETTLGYESGLRGRGLGGRLNYSTSGFLLYNRNIARGNPLYNDPIADANQTQPQLVASGEEQFTGARMDVKFKPIDSVQVTLKGTFVRGITTASPDLPQEVDRPISRLPSYNVTAVVRYYENSPGSGFNCGAGWMYLDGYVANYADPRRDYLDYPGFGLLSLNAGYRWRRGARLFAFDAGLRNAFDRDLVASNARIGADREITFSGRLVF